LVLLWITRAAATAISFYVDSPDIRSPTGHAFVQMIPMLNAQAGNPNLVYGLYPSTVNIFGGPGRIGNDSRHRWDFRITYNVTPAQYNGAVAVINADIAAPPAYHLLPSNCVDWTCTVSGAAAIVLPAKRNRFGIGTPTTFENSLRAIGAGGVFRGGTVGSNAANVAPNGGPLALAGSVPRDFDFDATQDVGHDDPLGLATFMDLSADINMLSTFMVNTSDSFDVSVLDADPADALVSMDWGDGSPFDAQATTFAHDYAFPGDYLASLLVVDSGAVHRYQMPVSVSGAFMTQSSTITVDRFSPATGTNPNFDEAPILLFSEVPEPATIFLFVSGIPVLVLMRRKRTREEGKISTHMGAE